jgi:hypothetical protein
MLDLWLPYPWHLSIYVSCSCDYVIRAFSIFTYFGTVTTISVTSKYLRILNLWLHYSRFLDIYVFLSVTTISVTSKYLRMLDPWLQYLCHLYIYVCWTCASNIREIQRVTCVGLVTTISVNSQYLRMLHLWLQYPWHLNSYVCWICD